MQLRVFGHIYHVLLLPVGVDGGSDGSDGDGTEETAMAVAAKIYSSAIAESIIGRFTPS